MFPYIPIIYNNLYLMIDNLLICSDFAIPFQLTKPIQEELRADGGREDKADDFHAKAEGEL